MSTEKTRTLLQEIEVAGGWESVYDALADGASVGQVAKKFGVSRTWFTRIARQDPERVKLWEQALRDRGDAMAEEAKQIADDADERSPGGVQKAKLRVEVRQWLAAVDNARYRRATGTQVTVNIGHAHLDALRWREMPSQLPVKDAEIVHEAEPGDTPALPMQLQVASPFVPCLKCGAPATRDTRDTEEPTCAAHRLNGDGEPD